MTVLLTLTEIYQATVKSYGYSCRKFAELISPDYIAVSVAGWNKIS